jgi:cell fate (sporulation/competence/biofilm development) regulator YlbF (YheA/YmcA/DUF963 family)
MLYVRDPKMSSCFLREPFAEKAWFAEGTLKVLSVSKKTVPEWADFFLAAKAESETQPSGASEAEINSRLDFVEHAQQFTTPAKAASFKLTTEEVDMNTAFSPFLDDSDILMRQFWRVNAVLPDAVLDHIEKLGDAMDRVLEDNFKSQIRDLEQYQEIAGDFNKVKVWQQQLEARIGTNVPVFRRDFASLWNAIEFGMETLDQEDKKIEVKVEDVKSQVERLESVVELLEKEMADWKTAVATGFQDVDTFIGKHLAQLEDRQKELELKMNGSGPRIRNGVLFNHSHHPGLEDGSVEGSKMEDADGPDTLHNLHM